MGYLFKDGGKMTKKNVYSIGFLIVFTESRNLIFKVRKLIKVVA